MTELRQSRDSGSEKGGVAPLFLVVSSNISKAFDAYKNIAHRLQGRPFRCHAGLSSSQRMAGRGDSRAAGRQRNSM